MKKQVVLDGALMKDKSSAHRHLARQLEFPKTYKGSLDELSELLSSLSQPLELIWLRHEAVFDQLEEYGEELFQTIVDAAEANRFLNLYLAQNIFEED